MCKCKEEDYKYEDYIDEYSGIPEYERVSKDSIAQELGQDIQERRAFVQLDFQFDTERCPAYDK